MLNLIDLDRVAVHQSPDDRLSVGRPAVGRRAARAARIYDGPDEIHKVTVARQVLKGYTPADVAETFAECPERVMPSASRSLLAAGPDPARLHDAVASLAAQFAAR